MTGDGVPQNLTVNPADPWAAPLWEAANKVTPDEAHRILRQIAYWGDLVAVSPNPDEVGRRVDEAWLNLLRNRLGRTPIARGQA